MIGTVSSNVKGMPEECSPARRLDAAHFALVGLPRRSPLIALGPPDDANLPAPPTAAEEPIGAIGLEARHKNARRHLELLQLLPRARVDAPQIALLALPRGVPQLAVHPRDTGDEAVR